LGSSVHSFVLIFGDETGVKELPSLATSIMVSKKETATMGYIGKGMAQKLQ